MLSAKTEKHAVGATLLFNVAHYALRPWPWMIVALASLIVFPDIKSLQQAFPHVESNVVRNDLAYPAMLTFLPPGLLGLVVASLIAAFMSTISTHLNWGSSYIVNDFYKRFVNPEASDKQQVLVGRISTVALMIMVGFLALLLSNALQAFEILLQIGAGTGLLFILRWFWWRINPFSEITAMVVSFVLAFYFKLIHPHTGLPELSSSIQLIVGITITTISWLSVTFLTKPTEEKTLRNFYKSVHPGGPGWKKVLEQAKDEGIVLEKSDNRWDVPTGILGMVFGCVLVYSILFGTGFFLSGRMTMAYLVAFVAALATFSLYKIWPKVTN